jgi:hypothetical protein
VWFPPTNGSGGFDQNDVAKWLSQEEHGLVKTFGSWMAILHSNMQWKAHDLYEEAGMQLTRISSGLATRGQSIAFQDIKLTNIRVRYSL